MSISQTKNFFEKTGCGVAVMVIAGLAMAAGLFGSNCRNNNSQSGGAGEVSKDLGPAIMTVGKTTVPAQFFSEAFQTAIGNQEADLQAKVTKEGDFEGLAPRDYAILNGQVLIELKKSAYMNEIAIENGIDFDYKAAKEFALKKLEKAIIDAKNQLIKDKKLSATAGDEDVKKAFKTAYNKEPDEIRSEQTKIIDDLQLDPLKSFALTRAGAIEALTKKIADSKVITDAQLEGEFETFTVKMIGFAGAGMSSEEMTKAATAAKADLDKGMAFEAAIVKYSKVPVTPGKKPGEETIEIPAGLLSMSPGLNGLLPLKDGEVSPILTLETGPVIYKLIKRAKKLPENYELDKENMKLQAAMQKASVEITQKLEEKMKTTKITFADPAYETMIATLDFAKSPDAQNAASIPEWKKYAEKFDKMVKGGNATPTATYGSYLCAAEAYRLMKPEEQKAYGKIFAEASENILKLHNNSALRLQIVDFQLAKKDAVVAESLLLAAEANLTFGPIGLSNHQAIESKLLTLAKANLMPTEIKSKIDKVQKDWIKSQKELVAERQQAEMEKKKAEEEEIKAQAEAKKEEEAAKKEGASGSSGTTPEEPKKTGAASSSDLLGGEAPPAPSGQ